MDIGAYEYQDAATRLYIAWLQQHGLPVDASSDSLDLDGDGMGNWPEWQAGTDAANSSSLLKMGKPVLVGADLLVRWESVTTRTYALEASRTLSVPESFQNLATGIQGQSGTTIFRHGNALSSGPWFYRVRVE